MGLLDPIAMQATADISETIPTVNSITSFIVISFFNKIVIIAIE